MIFNYPESGFCTYLILNIFQLHNGDTNKSILSSEAETVIFHSNMQLIHRETIFISNHAKNSKKVLKKSLKSEELYLQCESLIKLWWPNWLFDFGDLLSFFVC